MAGEQVLKFDRGQVIQFTSGEYSDFSLNGSIVTIKPVDLPALAKQFIAEEQEKLRADENEWRDTPDPDGLIGWLIAKGYAMPLEATNVWLGTYDEFSSELGGTR